MSESKIEEVALAIAEKYHGREVTSEYLFGEATGGVVFVECAKAAIEAMHLDDIREQLRTLALKQDVTHKRLTYTDGFQQGLIYAIERIDASLKD